MSAEHEIEKQNIDPAGARIAGVSYSKFDELPSGRGRDSVLIADVHKDDPLVTRKELWCYYLYSNGDCGVGPVGYTQVLFQSLATTAGYDPVVGPGSSCTAQNASGKCVVPWGSGTKSVASVVLAANGISFGIMTIMFTTIGSAGDYGTFGRWLLFVVTVVCWAAQYACMALTSPSHWRLAMVLYIVGFVTYGATLVFYLAAFPRLARNTPASRSLRQRYKDNEISGKEYELRESQEKSRICSISTASHVVHNNVGYLITCLLNPALLLPPAISSNPRVNNYVIFLLSQAIASVVGTFVFWRIQRYWNISTKAMFFVTNVVTILIPLWGMSGVWTNKFGFHNAWEFWVYNVVFGLFQAPYYPFSQVMMAELSPPGFDNMFFGLFGLSNRAASMIGPNIIQAIIDKTGNNWQGFPFLFALCTTASLIIWFVVDMKKGKEHALKWTSAMQRI
ncbi:hypothetical protein ID866_8732 [Astraeus odoratus]|nr:hypothetical protein ID866_8732 [Astraeus odoratus]